MEPELCGTSFNLSLATRAYLQNRSQIFRYSESSSLHLIYNVLHGHDEDLADNIFLIVEKTENNFNVLLPKTGS